MAKFIVRYVPRRICDESPVYLSDSWKDRRNGVPTFALEAHQARQYDSAGDAYQDAVRYCPGESYLAGEIVELPGEPPETSARRNSDLEKRFTYHSPKEGQPEKYQAIRGKAKELAYLIGELCPTGREHSLALTKVEEAVFWANAAIARN